MPDARRKLGDIERFLAKEATVSIDGQNIENATFEIDPPNRAIMLARISPAEGSEVRVEIEGTTMEFTVEKMTRPSNAGLPTEYQLRVK